MRLTEGKPFTNLYQKRLENNQDLFIIIDDRHNRRGTGKTVLSLGLGETLDRTDDGLTKEKVTLQAPELIQAYTEQPKGSALILDEAELGTSKYRAGSQTNRAIRELVSVGRIMEKTVLMNLPNQGEMDRDLKALADVWIMVEKKGLATVHFLGWNPYKGHPLTPKKQIIRWSDISDPKLKELYDYLTDIKERHLTGELNEERLVKGKDHHSAIENAREEASIETRNELIKELYQNTELTQQDVANSVGLSRSRVADILSG